MRSKDKVAINPCPEVVNLIARARSVAVHYSYGKRLQELNNLSPCIPHGMSEQSFKIDHNSTRIQVSRHTEVHI